MRPDVCDNEMFIFTRREWLAFAGPREFWPGIAGHFAFEKGIAPLSETGITKDLLKDWWRAVHDHRRSATAHSVCVFFFCWQVEEKRKREKPLVVM